MNCCSQIPTAHDYPFYDTELHSCVTDCDEVCGLKLGFLQSVGVVASESVFERLPRVVENIGVRALILPWGKVTAVAIG